MVKVLSLLELFSQAPLCKGLSAREVETLFDLCDDRRFEADALIFKQGEPADALWVVLAGDVEVSIDGKVLAEMGPGAALGELSILREKGARSATVRALCPVHGLRLPRPRFQRLLDADDLAALKVVRNLALQLAQRLDALNDRLVSEGARRGLEVARTALRHVLT
jgi:CRP-like cAMP-binding protein